MESSWRQNVAFHGVANYWSPNYDGNVGGQLFFAQLNQGGGPPEYLCNVTFGHTGRSFYVSADGQVDFSNPQNPVTLGGHFPFHRLVEPDTV